MPWLEGYSISCQQSIIRKPEGHGIHTVAFFLVEHDELEVADEAKHAK